jgi:predicted methyltransferase
MSRLVFLLLLLLGGTASAQLGGAPETLRLPSAGFACTADAECVVVPGRCEDEAIHRAFLRQARAQKETMGCLRARTLPTAVCLDKRCSLMGVGLGSVGARPPKATIGHHFSGDPGRFAKDWDDPKRELTQKPAEVVKIMAIAPGMTVADVGAGTGYFVPHLAKAVGPEGRVLALDIEMGMVKYLEERGRRERWTNVTARKVEPRDPGLGERSVDRVLIVNTWHHIGARAAYAFAVGRALRPGGRLVIVDFELRSPEGPPPADRLTAEQVAAELELAGLRPEIVKESLPHHFVVVGHVAGE